MKIEINVDELQFKELLEGELKNLPKDKIQEVIVEGIRTYVNTHPEMIKDLFVDSSYSWREQPTYYLKEIVKNHIPQDAFKDTVEGIVYTLKNNYDKILRDAIIDMLIGGIFNSYNFQDRIRETLNRLKTEDANGY